ncbi:hypothetical protein HDU82_001649 [Entophlyctis luteolus]|nr:hypothetical protein HDU82_001649 [Entophlyctis luteolus]
MLQWIRSAAPAARDSPATTATTTASASTSTSTASTSTHPHAQLHAQPLSQPHQPLPPAATPPPPPSTPAPPAIGAGTRIAVAPTLSTADWIKEPSIERFYGLENALYSCRPFRECVLNYSYPLSAAILAAKAENICLPNLSEPLSPEPPTSKPRLFPILSSGSSLTLPFLQQLERLGVEQNEETLLTTLKDLFSKISTQKKKTGVMKPVQFVTKLRKENVLFQGTTQQDAQEFLNYILNAISEILLRHKKEYTEKLKLLVPDAFPSDQSDPLKEKSGSIDEPKKKYSPSTWVHELFEGLLTNETKCLTCETATNRDEAFLDLSVDISQHSSISTCLRNFSTSETLCAKDKFYCENCKSLQEAEKRMKIKSLPNILAVHLKRFKYVEQLQRFVKLNYRVVFPFELKLFNTSDDAEDPDRLYALSSVIVHLGIGPHMGHYISLVKSADGGWVLFDDDVVERVDETELARYFGDTNNPGTGYILLYERVGFDARDIVDGMRTPASTSPTSVVSGSANGAVNDDAKSSVATSVTAAATPSLVSNIDTAPTESLQTTAATHPVPVIPTVTSASKGIGGLAAKFKRPSNAAATQAQADSATNGVPARASTETTAANIADDALEKASGVGKDQEKENLSWWRRK